MRNEKSRFSDTPDGAQRLLCALFYIMCMRPIPIPPIRPIPPPKPPMSMRSSMPVAGPFCPSITRKSSMSCCSSWQLYVTLVSMLSAAESEYSPKN